MLQQLPWAALLYLGGGPGWVLWGVCARVAVSITGHWLIGYFAHNSGHQTWRVDAAAVQGFDVNYCGLITFGECWHNNHHAYPRSAKIGLRDDQLDPGWWLILALQKAGLVWNIQTPDTLPVRPELVLRCLTVNATSGRLHEPGRTHRRTRRLRETSARALPARS